MLALPCSVAGELSGILDNLGDLDDILDNLSDLPHDAAMTLSALLREGDTPEIRSFAARLLPDAGKLAEDGPVRAVGRYAPVAGFALGVGADVLEGQGLGRAALTEGGASLGAAAGTDAGAAVGAVFCATATAATLGLGALTCPVFVIGGGAIGGLAGGWAGRKLGSLAADLNPW